MPNYSLLDLTAQVRAIGRASIFYGAGAYIFNSGGADLALTHLGDTEGEISIAGNEEYSDLTLPELTGPAIHNRYLTGFSPQITIPLYAADPDLRDIVSPTGTKSGGFWRRRPVTEYTLAIFPEQLFIESNAQVAVGYTKAGGWTVGGDAASASQTDLLDLSIWFWRGHFTQAFPMYRHEDGGKVVQTVTFQAMWNSSMPDGHRLWTVGRPDQADTPIHLAAA